MGVGHWSAFVGDKLRTYAMELPTFLGTFKGVLDSLFLVSLDFLTCSKHSRDKFAHNSVTESSLVSRSFLSLLSVDQNVREM